MPDPPALQPAHGEEIEEVETPNQLSIATPQDSARSHSLIFAEGSAQPVKNYFDEVLRKGPSGRSGAELKLRIATFGNVAAKGATSYLEDARDIDPGPSEEGDEEYLEGDHEGEEAAEGIGTLGLLRNKNSGSRKGRPTLGGLHVPRRSDRLRAQQQGTPESRLTISSPAPSPASRSNRIQKRQKRNPTKTSFGATPPRRSPRLAKPLDVFHKFPELPPELQLMVWEAVIQPRLAYICNRYSTLEHANTFGVQNKLPIWFMTCRMSVYVAKLFYNKMFGQNAIPTHAAIGHSIRPQDINPSFDIIIYEPCHNGCRAHWCAQQYHQEDRAQVRRLAVQIDSQHLPVISEPGWATVAKSWPNVHTLFMMKAAVRGPDQTDKAMIRIKEGDYELALRKRFEAWKKGPGRGLKLNALEFVRVVEQEPMTKNIANRYRSVQDRKTGLVEDIILG